MSQTVVGNVSRLPPDPPNVGIARPSTASRSRGLSSTFQYNEPSPAVTEAWGRIAYRMSNSFVCGASTYQAPWLTDPTKLVTAFVQQPYSSGKPVEVETRTFFRKLLQDFVQYMVVDPLPLQNEVDVSSGFPVGSSSEGCGIFSLPQLKELERFGYLHAVECIYYAKLSLGGTAAVNNTTDFKHYSPSLSDIRHYFCFPTRLFCLLEIAYVFEAFYLLKDFFRLPTNLKSQSVLTPESFATNSATLSFNDTNLDTSRTPDGFYRHPISDPRPSSSDSNEALSFSSSSNPSTPSLKGANTTASSNDRSCPSPTETSIAFLSSFFYSFHEILQVPSGRASSNYKVDWQFVERCLSIHVFTRLPVIHALKNYVLELLPILLSILTSDNEIMAEAAHRLMFNILKAFHRDFDSAEAYLQISTNLYLQALHSCASQLSPWNTVLTVEKEETLHDNSGGRPNTLSPHCSNHTGSPHEREQLVSESNNPKERLPHFSKDISSGNVVTSSPHKYHSNYASSNYYQYYDDSEDTSIEHSSDKSATATVSLSYLSQLLGHSDPSLAFVHLPPGSTLGPAVSSLKLLMEVPLVVMLLLQLNAAPVKQHSSLILERLLQFLSFLEPHKNYLKVYEFLKRGHLPPPDLLLLDFKLQRDLLDAQVKTLAFISFFIRSSFWGTSGNFQSSGAGVGCTTALQGATQYSQTNSATAPPMAEIASIILDYLNIAPYQVIPPNLQRFHVLLKNPSLPNVPQESPSLSETQNMTITTTSGQPFALLVENKPVAAFDVALDHLRMIYFRREVLVAFRSITSSSEFRSTSPLTNISRALSSRVHLGTGLAAIDSLKPFTSQLRVEIVNHIRCSENLQRILLSTVSSSRSRRTELHRKHLRGLLEVADKAQTLLDQDRSNLLHRLWRWKPLHALLNSEETSSSVHPTNTTESLNIHSQQLLTTPCSSDDVPMSNPVTVTSPLAEAGSPPSTISVFPDASPSGNIPPHTLRPGTIPTTGATTTTAATTHQQQQQQQLTYADVRALLLARSINTDVGRSALPPADKVLPLSVLAELTHAICTDVHDTSVPLYTQTLLIRALIVISEWVDKLCVGIRGRQPPVPGSSGPPILAVNHFMDQKEAADVHRRILETCSNKLSSVQYQLPQFVAVARPSFSHRPTTSSLSEPALLLSSSPVIDCLASSRQAAWVNPPLRSFLGIEGRNIHPTSVPTLLELLKEIKMLIRALCQAVKLSAFLLTVVGIPGEEQARNIQESHRLLHAAPLNDSDYQTVRTAVLSVLEIASLYGSALSRCSVLPQPNLCSGTIENNQPPNTGIWKQLTTSLLLNSLPQLSTNTSHIHPAQSGSSANACLAQWSVLYIDKQLSVVQQEERELAEAAAYILANMHYTFIRRFLQEEISGLIFQMSIYPCIVSFFEVLYQQPGTSQATINTLIPQLFPSFGLLTDHLAQSCIRIPETIGRSILAIHSLQRKRTINAASEGNTKQNNVGSAGVKCVGNVILVDSSLPTIFTRYLSQCQHIPYLPNALVEPLWPSFCPSKFVIDPKIDLQLLHRQQIRWSHQQGFQYDNERLTNKSRSLVLREETQTTFLDNYMHPPQLLPFVLKDCPRSLQYVQCWHDLSTCNENTPLYEDADPPHSKNTTAVTERPTQAPSSSSSSSSLSSYIYTLRSGTHVEAAANAVRLINPSAAGLHERDCLTGVTFSPLAKTSLYSKTILITSVDQPSIIRKDLMQLNTMSCLPEDSIGRLIAYDQSLIPIALSNHRSPCTLLSNFHKEQQQNRNEFALIKAPSLKIVTDFAATEGKWPGVETLTHTASGCERLPIAATYIQLWRLTLKSLCSLPTIQANLQNAISDLICSSLQRILAYSKNNSSLAVVHVLRSFFRYCFSMRHHHCHPSALLKFASVSSNSSTAGSPTALPFAVNGSASSSAGRQLTATSTRDFVGTDILKAIPALWFLATCHVLSENQPSILEDAIAESVLKFPVPPTTLPQALHLYSRSVLRALKSRNVSLISLGLRTLETILEVSNPSNVAPYLTSPSYPKHRIGHMPPVICYLMSLLELPPRMLRADPVSLASDHYLREVTDPVTQDVEFQIDKEDSPENRNSISSYAARILGLLGKTGRGLLLEPPTYFHTQCTSSAENGFCFGIPLLLENGIAKNSTSSLLDPIEKIKNCIDEKDANSLDTNTFDTTPLQTSQELIVSIHLRQAIDVATALFATPLQKCNKNIHDNVFSNARLLNSISTYNFLYKQSTHQQQTESHEDKAAEKSSLNTDIYPYNYAFPWGSCFSSLSSITSNSLFNALSHESSMPVFPTALDTKHLSFPWSLLHSRYCEHQESEEGHRRISPVTLASFHNPNINNIEQRVLHEDFYAIEKVFHPFVLGRWRKQQALKFFEVVVKQLFRDDAFDDNLPTESPNPDAIHSPYSNTSIPSGFLQTFYKLIEGLLFGCGDLDDPIRKKSRNIVLSIAAHCAVTCIRMASNPLTISFHDVKCKQLLLHPFHFITALIKFIDLTAIRWAASSFAIQTLSYMVRMIRTLSPDPNLPFKNNPNFLLPWLRGSHNQIATESKATALTWAIYELLRVLPKAYQRLHFKCLASALYNMLKSFSTKHNEFFGHHIQSHGKVLLAGVIHETLCLLCLCYEDDDITSPTVTMIDDANKDRNLSPLDNDMDTTFNRKRYCLYKFVMDDVLPNCFTACILLRQQAFTMIHYIAELLSISSSDFLTCVLPADLINSSFSIIQLKDTEYSLKNTNDVDEITQGSSASAVPMHQKQKPLEHTQGLPPSTPTTNANNHKNDNSNNFFSSTNPSLHLDTNSLQEENQTLQNTLLEIFLIKLSQPNLYGQGPIMTITALDILGFLISSCSTCFSIFFGFKCAAIAASIIFLPDIKKISVGKLTPLITSTPPPSPSPLFQPSLTSNTTSNAVTMNNTNNLNSPIAKTAATATAPDQTYCHNVEGTQNKIPFPTLIQSEMRAMLIIHALRVAKLAAINLITTRSSSDSLTADQHATVNRIVAMILHEFQMPTTSLPLDIPAKLPEHFMIGLILSCLGDIDIHIAQAAQHALLVVMSYYAMRQREEGEKKADFTDDQKTITNNSSSRIAMTSLFPEELLFTYLKKNVAFLSLPPQRNAANFLALSRTITMLKGAFSNTSIAAKLIDVAFALCDGCDNLAKQTAASRNGNNPTAAAAASTGIGSTPTIPPELPVVKPQAALCSFSPNLSPCEISSVAAGLVACIAALPTAALSANLLCRSALRLAVGLVDFSEINISQAEAQTNFRLGIGNSNPNLIQPGWVMNSGATSPDEALLFSGVRLSDIFIDFCISHADLIVDIVWLRSELTGPENVKLGLPFILSRGKTSAFLCRALRSPKAGKLRKTMQTKSAVMSRLLREALELQYPGLFYSVLNSTVQQQAMATNSTSTANNALAAVNAFNAMRKDMGSYASEAIASTIQDIFIIIDILATYDLHWLERDWIIHAYCSISNGNRPTLKTTSTVSGNTNDEFISQATLQFLTRSDCENIHQKVFTVPPTVFHTLPLIQDPESPWTSKMSYPLIHCIVDIWTVGSGLLLEEAVAASTEEAAALEDAWMKTQRCDPCTPVPVPIFDAEKEFIGGPSLCAVVTLSSGGVLAHDDFHAFLHSKLSVNIAQLFIAFLLETTNSRLSLLKSTHNRQWNYKDMYTDDPVLQETWISTEFRILRLKLLFALCIPLATRLCQDFTFVENTFNSWFGRTSLLHHTKMQKQNKILITNVNSNDTTPSVNPRPFSKNDCSLLLRVFFIYILYSDNIPPRLKAALSRHLIIPILLYNMEQIQQQTMHSASASSDMQSLPTEELLQYLNELNTLQPDHRLRYNTLYGSGEYVILNDSFVMTSLFSFLSLSINRRLPSDCMSVFGPITSVTLDQKQQGYDNNEPQVSSYFKERQQQSSSKSNANTTAAINFFRISTRHLEENQELQVEALRLIKHLAQLAHLQQQLQPPTQVAENVCEDVLCWRLCRSQSLIVRHWAYYTIAFCMGIKQNNSYGSLIVGQKHLNLQDTLKFLALLIQCPQLETRILTKHSADAIISSGIISPPTLVYGLLLPFFRSLSILEGSMPYIQILQSLCQLLARHSITLYSLRTALAPLCATALSRVALNAGSETRRVILDLLHTILTWELRDYVESPLWRNASETWVSSLTTLETACYYTVKASLTSASDLPIVSRALSAMTRCLLLNPNTPVRFQSMLKCLQLPPVITFGMQLDATTNAFSQFSAKRCGTGRLSFLALFVFDILLQFQTLNVLLRSLASLTQTLDPIWASGDAEVIYMLCRLINKLLHVLPPPPTPDLGSLIRAKITSTTTPSDIFWIRISQVIATGLGAIAGRSEALSQLLPPAMASGVLPFLYLPDIPTGSTAAAPSSPESTTKPYTSDLYEQRRSLNSVLESLEKTLTTTNSTATNNTTSAPPTATLSKDRSQQLKHDNSTNNPNVNSNTSPSSSSVTSGATTLTGIPVNPYLSVRLLMTLTSVDIPFIKEQYEVFVNSNNQNSCMDRVPFYFTSFPKRFLLLSFGLPALAALTSFVDSLTAIKGLTKQYHSTDPFISGGTSAADLITLLERSDTSTTKASFHNVGQRITSPLSSSSLSSSSSSSSSNPSTSSFIHHDVSRHLLISEQPSSGTCVDTIEFKLKLFSELLQFVVLLFFCDGCSYRRHLQKNNLIEKATTTGQWTTFKAEVDKLYETKFFQQKRLHKSRLFLFRMLLEIPERIPSFGVYYDLLKLLGCLIFGPTYDPLVSLETSPMVLSWFQKLNIVTQRSQLEKNDFCFNNNTDANKMSAFKKQEKQGCINSTSSRPFEYKEWLNEINTDEYEPWIPLKSNVENYHTFDYLDNSWWKVLNIQSTSSSPWDELAKLRNSRSFCMRSTSMILHGLFSIPESFGFLETAHLLHMWGSHYSSFSVPDIHLFYFDLLSRVVTMPIPLKDDIAFYNIEKEEQKDITTTALGFNNVTSTTTNLILNTTDHSFVFLDSSSFSYNTTNSSQMTITTNACDDTNNNNSLDAIVPDNNLKILNNHKTVVLQPYLTLCLPNYHNKIGIWVCQPNELLRTFIRSDENKIDNGDNAQEIKQTLSLIVLTNLFHPLLLGMFSAHPAIHMKFLQIINHALPQNPAKRLSSLLNYIAQPAFSQHPLSTIFAELLLYPYITTSTLIPLQFPKFIHSKNQAEMYRDNNNERICVDSSNTQNLFLNMNDDEFSIENYLIGNTHNTDTYDIAFIEERILQTMLANNSKFKKTTDNANNLIDAHFKKPKQQTQPDGLSILPKQYILQLCKRHLQYLNNESDEAGNWIHPLTYFLWNSSTLATQILTEFIPIIWKTMTPITRATMTDALVSIVSWDKTESIPATSTNVSHQNVPAVVPNSKETFGSTLTTSSMVECSDLSLLMRKLALDLIANQDTVVADYADTYSTQHQQKQIISPFVTAFMQSLASVSLSLNTYKPTTAHKTQLQQQQYQQKYNSRTTGAPQALLRQQQQPPFNVLGGTEAQVHSSSTSSLSTLAKGSQTLCQLAATSVNSSISNQFIYALVKAFGLCSPQILFPVPMLRRVATTFRCWYLAVNTLVQQVQMVYLLNNTSNTYRNLLLSSSSISQKAHVRAILDLCEQLGDTDTAAAIGIMVEPTNETRAALEDLNSGRWARAQDAFNILLRQTTPALDKDIVIAQQTAAAVIAASAFEPGSSAASFWVLDTTAKKNDNKLTDTIDISALSSNNLLKLSGVFNLQSPNECLQIRCPKETPITEISLWADQWVRSSTQLNQWNSLNEISSCSNVALTQDARSKLQDWPGVEKIVTTHSLATPQAAIGLFYASLQRMIGSLATPTSEQQQQQQQQQISSHNVATAGSSSALGTESSLPSSNAGSAGRWRTQSGATGNPCGVTLGDTASITPPGRDEFERNSLENSHTTIPLKVRLEEMENLLVACQKLIVAKARELPKIPGAPHLRTQLYSQLQVEANEGFRWISEFVTTDVTGNTAGSRNKTLFEGVDNRALMMAWRNRLLSNTDDMRSWSDLLVWRSCFFTAVQSLVSNCPTLSQTDQSLWGIYQQDVAWTILKFAQVANCPHRLPDVALALLSKLHTLYMFFTCPAYYCDYLTTATRCVKLCQTPSQLLAALNLLQSIDLDQYPASVTTSNNDPKRESNAAPLFPTLNSIDKLKAKIFVAKARVLTELPEFPSSATDQGNNIDWAAHYTRVIRHALTNYNPQQPPSNITGSTAPSTASPQLQSNTAVASSSNMLPINPLPNTASSSTTPNTTNYSKSTSSLSSACAPFSTTTTNSLTKPSNIQNAFENLSAALSFCPVLGTAWATYALLADRIFMSAQDISKGHCQQSSNGLNVQDNSDNKGELQPQNNSITNIIPMATTASPISEMTLLFEGLPLAQSSTKATAGSSYQGAAALVSYIMAAYLSPHRSRTYIARIFWILSFDDEVQTLSKAFGKFGSILNPSLWLPWIPELLLGLKKAERTEMYCILLKLFKGFPQAVFPYVRSEFNEATLLLNKPIDENLKESLMQHENVASVEIFLHELLNKAFEDSAIAPVTTALEFIFSEIINTCLPNPLEEIYQNMEILQTTLLSQYPQEFDTLFQNGQQQKAMDDDDDTYKLSNFHQLSSDSIQFLHEKILLKFKNFTTITPLPNMYCNTIPQNHNLQEQQWQTLKSSFAFLFKDFLCYDDNENIDEKSIDITLGRLSTLSVEKCIALLKKGRILFKYVLSQGSAIHEINEHKLKSLCNIQLLNHYIASTQYDHTAEKTLLIPGAALYCLQRTPELLYVKDGCLPLATTFHGLELTNIYINHHSSLKLPCDITTNNNNNYYHLQKQNCSRIIFESSNGLHHEFKLELCTPLQSHDTERTAYFIGRLGYILNSGKEARRRGLGFCIPLHIPLNPLCRLTSCPSTQLSLEDLWKHTTEIQDPDFFMLLHRHLLSLHITQRQNQKHDSINKTTAVTMRNAEDLQPKDEQQQQQQPFIDTKIEDEQQEENKHDVINSSKDTNTQQQLLEETTEIETFLENIYKDVCQFTSSYIIKHFIENCYKDSEQLYLFLRKITTDFSIWSLLSYILFNTFITPDKIMFDFLTSRCYLTDVQPTWDTQSLQLTHHCESIPFRFTRNLQMLFGPIGRLGRLPGSMFALLDGLASPKAEFALRTFINLLLRDGLFDLYHNHQLFIPSSSSCSSITPPLSSWNTKKFKHRRDELKLCWQREATSIDIKDIQHASKYSWFMQAYATEEEQKHPLSTVHEAMSYIVSATQIKKSSLLNNQQTKSRQEFNNNNTMDYNNRSNEHELNDNNKTRNYNDMPLRNSQILLGNIVQNVNVNTLEIIRKLNILYTPSIKTLTTEKTKNAASHVTDANSHSSSSSAVSVGGGGAAASSLPLNATLPLNKDSQFSGTTNVSQPTSCYSKIQEIIDNAADSKRISFMPSLWQPWI